MNSSSNTDTNSPSSNADRLSSSFTRKYLPVYNNYLATSSASASSASVIGVNVANTSSTTGTSSNTGKKSPNNVVLPKSVIFATAGIGGCLGWTVVHPFNTVAIRSNLASASGTKFSLKNTLKTDGFRSLYEGLSAGLARQVFYATSRFGLFETFRDLLHEIRGKTDFASRIGVGAVTGGIAAYISCPMEVCVIRMSNDSSLPVNERRNYKSLPDTFTRIMKEEGISAFWRGSQPFVARAMMVGVFQVATLDQFKEFYAQSLNQKRNSISNVFCSAMTSGLLYSMVTMPLEAAKNRMANQKPDKITGKLPFTGTFQTISKVASENGFFALYNGFAPYYLRCGGHTVCMFVFVQILRDAYKAKSEIGKKD